MKKLLIFALLSLFLVSGNVCADEPRSRSLDFEYEVVFKDIPPDTSTLKVWLPLLPETPYQIIEDMKIEPFDSSTIAFDKTYNNKILSYTIDSPEDSTFKVNVQYKTTRIEFANKPGDRTVRSIAKTKEDFSKYLKANELVTVSEKIKDIAADITKGKKTTLDKARAIYDYVFENVKYDKTTPGWGRGDTERVCIIGSGNCTDFHSLFISLARASNIPAKFVIGVPVPEKENVEIKGYHCWAEFYDDDLGWIPVDISEAWKDNSKYEYHFGAVGENRLEFTRGRDIRLEPASNGKPLNYFFHPYAEVDGKPFKKIVVNLKYKDRLL